jgi:hypothetical protein
MKRTEAIKKMAELFEEHSNNQQYKGYSHEGLSETFLDIAESIGMHPPQITKTDSGQFPGDAFSYKIHAWDEE